MDKGVQNNHAAQITISGRPEQKNDKGEVTQTATDDVVLLPGKNRLTPAQFEQIKSVAVIRNYFEIGLLSEVKAPEKAPAPAENGKPLEKMNKDELTAEAEKRGVAIEDGDTKAQILEKLQNVPQA